MTWDAFIELALQMHSTTTPSKKQNISPAMSAQSMEVGSSIKHVEFSNRDRLEVTLTYQRGRGFFFLLGKRKGPSLFHYRDYHQHCMRHPCMMRRNMTLTWLT